MLLSLVAVTAMLLWLLFRARAGWRRFVRREVRAALLGREGIAVVKEADAFFEIRIGDSTGTLYLGNLYAGLASLPRDETAQKEMIHEFVSGALSSPAAGLERLSLERDRERLMPRLLPKDSLAQTAAAGPLPHRESGLLGLAVTYVLDSEQAVMYLTEKHLEELGLDLAALDALALANLRNTFAGAVVRHAIEQRTLSAVKRGDSFDATRILLVPEHLAPGESLIAVIPDRETLLLMTAPEDGNCSELFKLARTPGSPYTLLNRPVRVTREGFERL